MFHILKPAFTTSTYKKMFFRHYIQLFLIYIVLFITAITLFSYQSYQHKKELLHQSADSLCEFSEGLLREFQTVAFNVGKLSSLQMLYASGDPSLNFSKNDSTTFFNAQHELVSHKALNKHVSSMSVYLNNKEYIVSDYGTITLESFCQSVFNMDSVSFKDYLDSLSLGYSLYVPQSDSAETSSSLQSICILPLRNGTGRQYGFLFLFLNDAQILKELDAAVGAHMEYFIVNKDQTLLFSSSDKAGSLSSVGIARLTSDKKYISTVNTYIGWIHYVGYAATFLQRQRIFYGVLFLLLFLAGCILLLPLINTICKKNYAPIRELSSLLADTDSADSREPEYDTLKDTVSTILENKALVEQQLSLYKPILVNSFLLELLSSNVEENTQILRGLSSLGIELPFSTCFCMALTTPSLSHDYLYQLAEDLTTNDNICLYLSCRKQVGVLFFNSSDKHQALLAQKSAAIFLEEETLVTSYGIGSISEDLKYAPLSYSQALFTLDCFSLQDIKAITFDAIFTAGILNLQTPDTLKSLDASFAACRFQTVKENFTEYFRLISKSGYGKKEHLVYARAQLLTAISKLPESYLTALDTESLRALDMDDSHAFFTLQTQCMDLLDTLSNLHERCSTELSHHASGQILNWLDEHLCDENLSLNYFAEMFSLSESNMSRKIKALTGENFLSYVNSKRIEHACTLLKTTDLSVLHIARVSGYENDITFRRIFKKYMGVTPGEYRSQSAN